MTAIARDGYGQRGGRTSPKRLARISGVLYLLVAVFSRDRRDFADGAHRYDLIIDIAGNPSLARLRRALTPPGPPSSSAARTPAI